MNEIAYVLSVLGMAWFAQIIVTNLVTEPALKWFLVVIALIGIIALWSTVF